jgi:hypothetical protein
MNEMRGIGTTAGDRLAPARARGHSVKRTNSRHYVQIQIREVPRVS